MFLNVCLLILSSSPAVNGFAALSPAQILEQQSKKSKKLVNAKIEDEILPFFAEGNAVYYNQEETTMKYAAEPEMISLPSSLFPAKSSAIIDDFFLPKQVHELAQKEKLEELLDTEMISGRIAMVATFLLLGTEVMDGKSIPEQVNSVLHFL